MNKCKIFFKILKNILHLFIPLYYLLVSDFNLAHPVLVILIIASDGLSADWRAVSPTLSILKANYAMA